MSVQPADGSARRLTTATFAARKAAGQRIVMLTAYDFASARLVDAAGIDAILVGDSLGMTVLGYDSTLPVTLEDMVSHTAAVSRAGTRALVIADMPFMTFQVSVEDALRNAGRLMSEGGAGAVKIEGGQRVAATVARMVDAGIPVMGHVGLTPQSVHQLGGYKVQGKAPADAVRLLDDCLALQDAGAFSVVLECVPAELAAQATSELAIPTIGIGAGAGCDGEVQVFHDVLGLGGDFTPRHAKRFAEVGEAVTRAVAEYADEVRAGTFPSEEQATHMESSAADAMRSARSRRLREA